MNSKIKVICLNLTSIVIILLLFVYIDITSFWDLVKSIPIWYYFVFILFYTVSFFTRTHVWKEVYSQMDENPPFRILYFTIGITWLLNELIPGRFGDLMRIEISSKSGEIEYGKSIASVILLRVLDLTFLLLISGLGLIILNLDSFIKFDGNSSLENFSLEQYQFALIVGLLLIGGAIVVILLLTKKPEPFKKIFKKIPRVGNSINNLIDSFVSGIKLMGQKKQSKIYLKLISEYIFIWFCEGFLMVLLCYALDLPISWLVIVVGLFLSYIIRLIPTTPGSWGISEIFWAGFIFALYPALNFEFLVSVYLFDHIMRLIYAGIYGALSIPRVQYKFKFISNEKDKKNNI